MSGTSIIAKFSMSLNESFPAWYKQSEWHAKFIAGATFQKYNSIINNVISSFW